MLNIYIYFLTLSTSVFATPILQAEIISQTSDDVQVLQAWRADAISFDVSQCVGRDPVEGETINKDCSAYATRVTKAAWANQESPAANSWQIPYTRYQNYLYSRNGSGHIVEVRVLVKRTVLEANTFSGIGFYVSNQLEQGVRFIPKNDLHIVSQADVALKSNGEAAAVMRFVIYMPATAGASGTSWSMDSVVFKPFAQFDADGHTWQNWEAISEDFQIYRQPNGGGRHQVVTFDRQSELLRQ